jgi:Tfp pilus assembly protein PilO
MRHITPILFIVLSLALFFVYTNGAYSEVSEINAELNTYKEALHSADVVREKIEKGIQEYQNFTDEDIARLEKLLPDTVDNIHLIIDVDGIARTYGLTIRDIAIVEKDTETSSRGSARINSGRGVRGLYEETSIQFSVRARYSIFMNFLHDLEESLRVLDIKDISFISGEDGEVYDFTLTIDTYWLK